MADYILPQEPTRFTQVQMDRLLLHAAQHQASDITLQTDEPIFAEIYGRLHPLTKRPLSNPEVGDLINTIYGPNGTAQILGGHDIDTHYEFRPNRADRYRYRVNATGCMVEGHDAIQITLRSIPTTPPALADLHLPQGIWDTIAPSEGIVYVTGATGSGKSTLLAAIIRYLVEQPGSHRKVLTYESPIEFVYDELILQSAIVSQSEIPRHLPTFAAGVRNALRRKPGLILVGESRDTETIAASLEAALTGHPVYTTLHTNGVTETIRRLVTAFPADERAGRIIDILETVRLVIWQKLIPSLDGQRVALREFLVFDEVIRDRLIATDPNQLTAVVRKMVKDHGQTMLVDAERYYQDNRISEREYRLVKHGYDMLDNHI